MKWGGVGQAVWKGIYPVNYRGQFRQDLPALVLKERIQALKGTKVNGPTCLLRDGKGWKLERAGGCRTLWIHQMPLSCALYSGDLCVL